jgi:heme exporter protein A
LTTKLTANDLTLLRGERCLFKSLNFALSPGELLILEGQNGSGKTSLMRALAGLLEFETGDVKWDGVSVRKNRQVFHGSLVWMAHRVGLKADLTLVENLTFEASLRAQSTADLERVALARMVLAKAQLWLMDEPFTNLDRDGRTLVMKLVSEHLSRDGMCIMAAHQDVEVDATVHKVVLQ